MKKETLFLLFLGVFILIAAAVFFPLPSTQFPYSEERDGLLFASTDKPVPEHLEQLSVSRKAILSPSLRTGHSNLNTVMFNASLLPTIVVAVGNDLNAVQFVRSFDENRQLAGCTTNNGNPRTLQELPPARCTRLLEEYAREQGTMLMLVAFPDRTLTQSQAVLSGNTLSLHPREVEHIQPLTLAVLEALYPNAQEVLERANQVSEQVS